MYCKLQSQSLELFFKKKRRAKNVIVVFCSISGLQASIFSYVSEFFPKETSARATSLLSMFMPANFILASTIGMILIPMDWRIDAYFLILSPWRLFVIIVCLTNLFNFIACTLMLSESPKFLLAVGETDETLHVLQRMYSMNTKQPRDVSYSRAIQKHLAFFNFGFFFSLCFFRHIQ